MNIQPLTVIEHTEPTDSFSDGSDEQLLLELFQAKDPLPEITQILENEPSWPFRYHLSPLRENLLSWFEFDSSSSLLEIGAGCGALTGLFCDRVKNVTAVELARLRADIISYRHRSRNNLSIISGNLHEVKFAQKFDIVTAIGVLEYAGRFTKTSDAYLDFLVHTRNLLEDDGTLILAIENKFGLKYWSGVKDDHTGRFFDGLENYPLNKDVQTFGKTELEELLSAAGFSNWSFYYPLPDYKLPIEVFSDSYLPTLEHNLRAGIFPSVDYAHSREFLFNEKRVMDNIILNKTFQFFANSFLVFAHYLPSR